MVARRARTRKATGGETVSAPLCPKCRTRPRLEYKSDAQDRGRYGPYCRECQVRYQKQGRAAWPESDKALHRMADQYRPKEDETNKKGKRP